MNHLSWGCTWTPDKWELGFIRQHSGTVPTALGSNGLVHSRDAMACPWATSFNGYLTSRYVEESSRKSVRHRLNWVSMCGRRLGPGFWGWHLISHLRSNSLSNRKEKLAFTLANTAQNASYILVTRSHMSQSLGSSFQIVWYLRGN